MADGAARAGWHFFPSMARRDHRFQMRVLPMFAMFVSMTALYALRGDLGTAVRISLPLHFLVPTLFVVLEAARWGDEPAARWLFDATPQAQAGPLLAGAHQAALLMAVLLPGSLYVPLVGAAYGAAGWQQGLFAVSLVLTTALLIPSFAPARLPFSARFRKQVSGSSMLLMWGAMIVAGLLAGAHYLCATLPDVQVGVQLALVPVIVVLWRRLPLRRVRWPAAD